MKKTIYLMGLLILAGAMVMSACKKDDDPETPVDNTPVLNFIGGAGYVTQDAEMTVGEAFKVGINASENANTKRNIASFKVIRTFNNVPITVFEETGIGDPNYTWEEDVFANTEAGQERWTFTVTDNGGQTKELAFVITTVAAGADVSAYLNVNMGSFNDTDYGSFMATATGTVLKKADAFAVQQTIDFAFYLGATNGSTFGAPSNANVKTVFALETAGWTTFNTTMFEAAPITGAEFDAIGATFEFPAFTGNADDIKQLSPGDVVYFKTHTDKLGFIKINTITKDGNEINIDVKVMD
jgi:hypothetical protein